jgi:hypothetical protein
MAIRVTCPSCHQRFEVSDKFAGREGPCPKCKGVIRIPDKNEEVVVHAPEMSGPKDSKGRLVLKPIARAETRLSGVQITLIVCGLALFLITAILLRLLYPAGAGLPSFLPPLGVTLLGPVLAYAGYTFLRDQERGFFSGRELWLRVVTCGLVYAASWLLMYAGWYAFNNRWELGAWLVGTGLMFAVGTTTGLIAFELDWPTGFLHYGLFFGCAVLLRWIAGWGIMPGQNEAVPAELPVTGWLPGGWDFLPLVSMVLGSG